MSWFDTIASAFRKSWPGFFAHRDRVGPIDMAGVFGSQAETATRSQKYVFDLHAKNVNANVSISIRATSDAVKSLPLNMIGTETIGGVDRDFDDNDHPANALIDSPNPDMTMREVSSHIVKSVLGDGNAYLTIERLTGPNAAIELWPRDPRNATPIISKGKITSYKFQVDDQTRIYPKDRVIHIKDISPEDPVFGVPRIESVRTEIYMDYLINEFNKNFFLNGATLNLMYIPDKLLSDIDHETLRDQIEKVTGANRAFKMFVNRFPGKLTSPDLKHKDIAFGELLRSNREKIFGAFGLPPFRGGVMEYANYANALAQDRDFWINTVNPLTAMIEDAINKQLVWPYFGHEVSLRYDYSEVPALKGDPKERAEVHRIYIDSGVMTPEQVAKEIGIEYEAVPKDAGIDDTDDDEAPVPTTDEEEEAENAILSLFSAQRRGVRSGLRDLTHGGGMMSALMFEGEVANKFLPLSVELDRAEATVGPALMNAFRLRTGGSEVLQNGAVRLALDNINRDTHKMLVAVLSDGNRYKWGVSKISKATGNLFDRRRAKTIAHRLVRETVRRAESNVGGIIE